MAFEYNINVKDNSSLAIKNISNKVIGLQQNFIGVDAKVNIFNKSLGMMKTAISDAAGIGIAKGFALLKDFGKEMVQSYDSATKLSDNIGVTAESIVGLRYAADLSSVGSENMDKNMAKLAQTISKAAGGSKEASATFAKMGIEVKNSDGTLKNSEQVLMEMADAFQKLPSGTERATLAMDVFGKSGASMVTMLKDGSGALREMVNEGAGAAGNIEGISASMAKLNDAMARGKQGVMAMLASLTDMGVIDAAVQKIDSLSKSFIQLSADRKNAAETEKTIARLNKDGDAASLKILAAEKEAIKISAIGTKEEQAAKKEKLASIEKELELLKKKNDFSYEELQLAELKGKRLALNGKETRLDDSQKTSVLEDINAQIEAIEKTQKAQAESARIAAENAANEKTATAAAVAGYEEKQKAMEEANKAAAKAAEEARKLNEQRIKEEAKEFDDLMKNKEDAIKKLADFEERMRLANLDGEERKLAQAMASYEKQRAELEAMHEMELMFAENEFEALANQGARLLDLERQKNIEIDAIKQEYADKEFERIQKEDEEQRKLHEQRLREEEELRDARLSSAEASMQSMQQITAGYKSYSTLYKASQIGEATINAVQSVLKTMSSTPYPFNIPLAALQSAAGAVQVRKIAATKMYAGGMIPGANTLVRANEEGREAILTARGVRNAGGPAGIDALNNGSQSIRNSYDNRKSNVVVNLHPVMVTPQTFRESIKPISEWDRQRW